MKYNLKYIHKQNKLNTAWISKQQCNGTIRNKNVTS